MSNQLLNGPGPIQPPNLASLLNQVSQNIFATLNCHQVGTIQSFDAEKQTAGISLTINRVVYNREQVGQKIQYQPNVIPYPILLDCPVFVLSGGTACLTMPVAAGDSCLVLFNDRDMDNWFSTGEVASPNSARMHHLSDGFALVGFRPLSRSITGYSTTAVQLRNGDNVRLTLEPDSLTAQTETASVALTDKVVVTTAGASVEVSDKVVVTVGGATVTVESGQITLDGAPIKLAASGADMLTLMDNLCYLLKNWVNSGSGPDTTTKLRIDAVKVLVDTLFTA